MEIVFKAAFNGAQKFWTWSFLKRKFLGVEYRSYIFGGNLIVHLSRRLVSTGWSVVQWVYKPPRLFKLVTMPALSTQRNIEIKAKILDAANFQEKIEIAKRITGSDGVKIVQHDVFFKVPNGRLKLRYEVGY